MGLSVNKQFGLLAGLPRTGSTLLTNILAQNPKIHTEGSSLLCQLMWDMMQTCRNYPALEANNRLHTEKDILSELPSLYYRQIQKPIILDKCRTWSHPANVFMWRENVNKNQKIVVLVRPLQDVVKSLVSLRIKNDWSDDLYADLLVPGSEPICRAADAIYRGKQLPQENFLYIDYRDLVSSPLAVLDLIYEFFGWDKFPHSIKKIKQHHHENDAVHGLNGMHEIRPQISVRKIDIELPPYVEAFCEELNNMIYSHKINGEWSMSDYRTAN